MPVPAFIQAPLIASALSRTSFVPSSSSARVSVRPLPLSRGCVRMVDDTPDSKPAVEMPTMDTSVFSDFVDTAQAKVADLQQQIQDIDADQLVADSTDAGKKLVDNLLAGDWLNRGELYGFLQLVAVFFVLKGPSFLDGLVALLTGPVLLVVGGVVSGKSLVDLGMKQLSIWPAPVPGAELKTDGMYQVVRHPMYLGLLLACGGFAVSTSSPSRIAITLAIAVLMLKKIEVEEDFLNETFPEYSNYSDQVPYKVIPKIY